jgi:hypothetical protein
MTVPQTLRIKDLQKRNSLKNKLDRRIQWRITDKWKKNFTFWHLVENFLTITHTIKSPVPLKFIDLAWEKTKLSINIIPVQAMKLVEVGERSSS